MHIVFARVENSKTFCFCLKTPLFCFQELIVRKRKYINRCRMHSRVFEKVRGIQTNRVSFKCKTSNNKLSIYMCSCVTLFSWTVEWVNNNEHAFPSILHRCRFIIRHSPFHLNNDWTTNSCFTFFLRNDSSCDKRKDEARDKLNWLEIIVKWYISHFAQIENQSDYAFVETAHQQSTSINRDDSGEGLTAIHGTPL